MNAEKTQMMQPRVLLANRKAIIATSDKKPENDAFP